MSWKLKWVVTILATLASISSATVHPNNPNFNIYNESATQPLTINYEELSENNTSIDMESNNNDIIKENINSIIDSSTIQNSEGLMGRYTKSVIKTDSGTETHEDTYPSVNTTYGPVQGYKWKDSENIIGYLDIPYGKFNMYEEPADPDKWENIREIDTHKVVCPQLQDWKYVGTVDCLTLSVFAPNVSEKAGVLFYIHESDFRFGSGDPSKYGPDYLVKKGLVLVLPNYRLGPLGFLCLRNETAPGNAALKDLTLALKWTKDNIELFGGDPNNIVVSGDGASAALAGYLALSPKSHNYISKVITDSGSILSHWAIDRHPINTATELAEHINKTLENGDEKGIPFGRNSIEDFFNEIDIKTLIQTAGDFKLKPCIERNAHEAFLNETPWYIITKEFEDSKIEIDFLIGSANHAGLKSVIQYNVSALAELSDNFAIALPNDLTFKEESAKRNVVQKLREHYFGTDKITLKEMKNISLYHTDVSYLGPDLRTTRALVTAGATVYLYEFSFIGELNRELQSVSDVDMHFGATRGDMVSYLFSRDDNEVDHDSESDEKDTIEDLDEIEEPEVPKKQEKKIIDLLTELWVTFIITGRPSANNIEWSPVNETSAGSADEEVWLSIADEATAITGFHSERLDLWTDIYKEYFVDANTATNNKAIPYYATLFFLMKLSKLL